MNLENCKLFSGLDPQYIEELLKKISYNIKKYEKHDLICTQFNFSKELGIILKGNVFVYKSLYNGDNFLLNRLEKNDLLGLACIYGNTKIFPSEMQATKTTEILFFSQESLNNLFLLEPQILKNFLDIMSNKIVFLNNKIEMMAISSIKERLEWLIYKNIYSADSLSKVNKTQLCCELGTSRSSLYRALNEFYNNK